MAVRSGSGGPSATDLRAPDPRVRDIGTDDAVALDEPNSPPLERI